MSDPAKYFKFLPAVYNISPVRGGAQTPFLGEYLKVFEKLLTGRSSDELDGTGLEATAPSLVSRRGIQETISDGVIGELFYPRLDFLFAGNDDGSFMPKLSNLADQTQREAAFQLLADYFGRSAKATGVGTFAERYRVLAAKVSPTPIEQWLSGLLDWLGSIIALSVDKNWSIDKKRWAIAQMVALYRVRGSVQGMQWLLDLWFDLPISGTLPPDGTASNFGVVVSNPQPNPAVVCGQYAPGINGIDPPLPVWVLSDTYSSSVPVISDIVSEQTNGKEAAVWAAYLPWLFEVSINILDKGNKSNAILLLMTRAIASDVLRVTSFVDGEKPAGTRYFVSGSPMFFLGGRSGPLSADVFDQIGADAMGSTTNHTTRLNYADGMFLTAALMTTEQSYQCDRLSYLMKSLMSPGLIDGLYVTTPQGTTVHVTSGAALDENGQLLCCDSETDPAVSDILATDGTYYVQILWSAKPAAGDASETDVTAAVTCVKTLDAGAVKVATLTVASGKVSASQAQNDCQIATPKAWSLAPKSAPIQLEGAPGDGEPSEFEPSRPR